MPKVRILTRFAAALCLGALAACQPMAPGTQVAQVDTDQPVQVALLVPTGSADGQREALGQSLINAARMAQADLAGVQLDVQVWPTAGDPAQAATAAQQALDAGADVILGPLFSTATEAVAPLATTRGVPVLSFSNNPDVAGDGVYVLGNTFDTVASRITGYSLNRGLTNFAVVHPDNPEGILARDAVTAAVQRLGGSVVANGAYPLSVQGITDQVPGIARQLQGSGANIVVLTDGPTAGLTFVAETLRGMGIREEAVRFAGLQRWDASPQAMAQPGLNGGWFAAPDQALATQFDSRYSAAYGNAPHPLAGLAYDGIAAIGALVAEAQAEGRNDPFSAARLTKPSGFAGVMGVFRLGPNGQAERGLAIYEVIEGVAQQVDPAPRSFAQIGS
ncbi:penicillin-binding protein activator [Halovulum dunhuangense]|uniref:Penicillin-binding protein activator n=1 Tax=Halovulum dunhuangense TaxID=1505036 RepID=A0A849KYS2_9RHOB|nr:penicillin-binding protein activator [Halovulum dunhuangense]NNU78892.1 penicillin-binding protein activator [Halovulum dunhuangense]